MLDPPVRPIIIILELEAICGRFGIYYYTPSYPPRSTLRVSFVGNAKNHKTDGRAGDPKEELRGNLESVTEKKNQHVESFLHSLPPRRCLTVPWCTSASAARTSTRSRCGSITCGTRIWSMREMSPLNCTTGSVVTCKFTCTLP